MSRVLVIGASGQLGTELCLNLMKKFGEDNVIPSDLHDNNGLFKDYQFEKLDVLDAARLSEIVKDYKIGQIYHLAAILSAKGESNPLFAWDLNMKGLLNVLELARNEKLEKIYWPSSIAVFGPTTPKQMTPQDTITDPNTVYGISKLAGERWCQYYHEKYGVDVRSLRYPGLIGWKSQPGGGTTDYAVEIYHKAIKGEAYDCFLEANAYLPMMYMDDAIRATIELMDAEKKSVKVRSSYNVAGMSFSPEEIYKAIKLHFPDFKVAYKPDFRQEIASSWPQSIDDTEAREEWGWYPKFDLGKMTEEMITNLAGEQVV